MGCQDPLSGFDRNLKTVSCPESQVPRRSAISVRPEICPSFEICFAKSADSIHTSSAARIRISPFGTTRLDTKLYFGRKPRQYTRTVRSKYGPIAIESNGEASTSFNSPGG